MNNVWLVCVVGAALGGCVAPMAITPETDVVPPSAEHEAVNPVAIEKIVSQVPSGQQIGVLKGGLLCIPHVAVTSGGGQFSITDGDYLEAVQHEFVAAGYPVTTSPTDLFSSAAADATRIRIGGRVTDLRANICMPMSGFGDVTNGKADVFVQINWEVFDAAAKTILFKLTTAGTGSIDTVTARPTHLAIQLAISMATRKFLASQDFQSLVRTPMPAYRGKA
jgi:hypothetical protein